MTPRFDAFVAIDWSGQAVERPRGLAVARVDRGSAAPVLIDPPGGWSRGEILEWLAAQAASGARLLVGVDFSIGLPFVDAGAYLPGFPASPANARTLWALVDAACGDDAYLAATGFLTSPQVSRHFRRRGGCDDLFGGGAGRLRVCEVRQPGSGLRPSSSFNLVGAAQVGKSSLTGMRVLHALGERLPVWPIDPVPDRGPLVVEIYTSIAARAAGVPAGRSKLRDAPSLDAALVMLGSEPHAPLAQYDDHATDAILTAAWLRANAGRADLWRPRALTASIAATEGWTFGVT